MPDGFLDAMTGEAVRQKRRADWAQTLDAGKDSVVVAVQDEDVVGLASGGPGSFAGYDAELFCLYLLRSAQGSGIGRALMRGLADDLAARGQRSVMLWVLAANPTRAFYERLGGELIGEKTVPVPGGELREVAYGWDTLQPLFQRRTAPDVLPFAAEEN